MADDVKKSLNAPSGLCPICRKPAVAAYKPFCSPRCRQIDLGKWLNGTYRIEGDDKPEDDWDLPARHE